MTTQFDTIDFHGLPALRMHSADGASAIVTMHGAHVVSWQPKRGGDRLFLSERSPFATGKPIRGGIPVIFPQFGPDGPLPRHGFARTRDWALVDQHAGEDFARGIWQLTNTADTEALWPAAFTAEITVLLGGDRLDVELAVDNTGTASISFTAALHTYCKVREVELATLDGLEGARYRDQTQGKRLLTDGDEQLVVSGEVDRLYPDAPPEQVLGTGDGKLILTREGFPDIVVWNPWEEKCAALADMAPDGFRGMLCVEAAAAAKPVIVAPGESWSGRQSFELR